MKKASWTIEQHTETGKRLSAMRDDLGDMIVSLGESYPNTTGLSGRAMYRLRRAQKEIDMLRTILDDLLYTEPAGKELGEKFTQIYYPHSGDSVLE